jgi:predicted peroxiredoxin
MVNPGSSDYMLYVGTHGMEHPTKAGLLFAAANATRRRGRDAVVALLGDSVFLLNDRIAENTKPSGIGRGSLLEMIQEAVKQGVKVYC